LLEGEVMPLDSAEARRWALAAAEQGVASAMTRLGMLYHNAIGVERDPANAAEWWTRAAAGGDARGQAMLGAALCLAAGGPGDPNTALGWLLRAKRGGSALADPFIQSARNALTGEQIAAIENSVEREAAA